MKKVFLAGASGAVGRPLGQLLARDGQYEVFGTTRSSQKAQELVAHGIKPVVVDVYNVSQLKEAVQAIRPDFLVHQLTDLPYGLPQSEMEAGRARNARLRIEGTESLLKAFESIPLEGLLLQSVAFLYAPGPTPHREDEEVANDAVRQMESRAREFCRHTKVMRYGRFYGPGTGVEAVDLPCRVHIEAAACASLILMREGGPGVYHVCEDSEYASNKRILTETSWSPELRCNQT